MLFHKGPLPPASADRLRLTTLASLSALALGGGLYLAGALFVTKLEHNNPALPPQTATPLTVVHYWRAYGDEPYTRQWLLYCLAGGSALPLAGFAALLRPVRRSLHGDARFASRHEIEQAGLFGPKGLIMGMWGAPLPWTPPRFLMLDGQKGLFCAAGPRSGKGAGLVQPNALYWRGSLVVKDVRKECYRITAGWRSLFSAVHLFDPLNPERKSAQWNAISRLYVRDDPDLRINDLQKIANYLSPDPASGDPFWPASCRDLFLGLGLYVIETADATPGFPRTMGEMMRQIMHGNDDGVGEHWRKIITDREAGPAPLSTACKRMLFDFINLSPQTQSSVRKTFTAKLQLWSNPLIDTATSGDSFDLRQLRRQRLSIYVGVQPGDLDRLSLLLNLFFTQMIDTNMDKMPEEDRSITHELLPIMDEFTAMGRMTILPPTIGLMGGYGIRPMIIVQSAAQLRAVYGADIAETIMTCCGARVVYAPHEQKYAEDVSRMLGNTTAQTESRSRARFSFGFDKGSVSHSVTARPLMNPQEVKMLGKDNEIILTEHLLPVLCRKIWYWKLGLFSRRALLPLQPVPSTLARAAAAPAGPAGAAAAPIDLAKPAAGAAPARALTPPDVGRLNRLSLTDYAGDFTNVDLPKGEPITDDDFNKAFASFQNAVQSAQEQ